MLRRSVFFKFLVLLLVFGLCASCFSLVLSRRGTDHRSGFVNPPQTSGEEPGQNDPGGSGTEEPGGSDPEPEIDYPTFTELAYSKDDFNIGGRFHSLSETALICYYVTDADPNTDFVVDYNIDLEFFTNNSASYIFQIKYLIDDGPEDEFASSVMGLISNFSDLQNSLTGRFKVPSTSDGRFEISFVTYPCSSLEEGMETKIPIYNQTDPYIHFSVYKEAAS